MKKGLYIFWILIIAITSCKDDDVNVFDKTSDERAAEAIASLKADLITPAQGWKVKYKPEAESGSFYVFLKFEENNEVTIRSDLGANEGEFFTNTLTYRIDNSLGLELVIESYSFFSFLFEQDQATFGAEYEFLYVNKTPDNALVFTSKTDLSNPTTLLLEEASASDPASFLGQTLSANLTDMADDLETFSSSLKLTYDVQDLVLYLSLDELRRTVSINSASQKTNIANTRNIAFSTGYTIRKDSLVFDNSFSGTYFGNAVRIKGIKFNTLSDVALTPCTEAIATHAYHGVTSANHAVTLEPTFINTSGTKFVQESDFYFSPLGYIIDDNGESAAQTIADSVEGALEMHLYYNAPLEDGTRLFGIGFVLENSDGSITIALREFEPVINGNNIVFNFKPGFRLFRNQNPDAKLENINLYLDALTQGDNTYILEYADDIYELHNPCTGWSFVFVNGNN